MTTCRRSPCCRYTKLIFGLILVLGHLRFAHAQARLEARPVEDQIVPEDALRLDRAGLRIAIDEQHATTTVEQQYLNQTSLRLEGRYLLRTGAGALVEGFAYWNGAQKIIGEVFERQTARQVYEEVSGLRRDPGLLEKEGEGAFSFRVFPIEPGEHKRIEVRFGQYLMRSQGTVEYRLPLSRPDTTVVLDVSDGRGIAAVESPTHRLGIVTQSGGRLHIEAMARSADTSELVVRYQVREAPSTLSSVIHRDRGQDAYVTLRLALPEALSHDAVRPKDVTLVVDHSGSMSGEPLAQALRAAEAVVTRLRVIDRVNVIIFDDSTDALYPSPRTVDEKTRTEALGFIRRTQAGGGTDIAGALRLALGAQENDQNPHLVLFLTDGQSDARAALAAAAEDRHDARVFTVGLGSGVEKPLLGRLAATKRGRFTFVESAQAIEERVTTLFRAIESPVLTDLELRQDGDVRLTSRYPRTLPDLVAGDELVITARAVGQGPLSLSLVGKQQGKSIAYSATPRVPAEVMHPWVGRLWAGSRVEHLLEEIALSGEKDELKNEVIELGLAYNLVTPYTSFLAIPESELQGAARAALKDARGRKAEVLKAHQDAVALSRSAMPPGDPLLSVKAPRDARQVTAYFPFGLVKDLTWDERAEKWQVRFLVPVDVADGTYQARVVIVHHDGTVELATAEYTIDSQAPDFEASCRPLTDGTGQGIWIEVRATEQVRETQAALVSDPRVRVVLARQSAQAEAEPRQTASPASELRFSGALTLPPGPHEIRVVVADEARNEADSVIRCEVR